MQKLNTPILTLLVFSATVNIKNILTSILPWNYSRDGWARLLIRLFWMPPFCVLKTDISFPKRGKFWWSINIRIEFYLFVSHSVMKDRGSTYKYRKALCKLRNLHDVDPSFIPLWETNKYEGHLKSSAQWGVLLKLASLPLNLLYQSLEILPFDLYALSQPSYPCMKCQSICVFRYTLHTLEYGTSDGMTGLKFPSTESFFDHRI